MCKAFSAIVLESGKVFWERSLDSHDKILTRFQILDKKVPPDFARVEISPRNGNYLKPDEWEFHLDEAVQPEWWNVAYEQYVWDEWKNWKGELDEILIYKPTVNPFGIVPPQKITKSHLFILKKWASAWDSVGTQLGIQSEMQFGIQFGIQLEIQFGLQSEIQSGFQSGIQSGFQSGIR